MKIGNLKEVCEQLSLPRWNGHEVAFTNGCFDILHAGHVQLLRDARQQARVLVVGLNSDVSVRLLKGEGRPINPQADRAEVLAALAYVEYVVVFDEPTPLRVIEAIRPAVLVKGSEYRGRVVVGAEFVLGYGGRVHFAEMRLGCSTTGMLERMRERR